MIETCLNFKLFGNDFEAIKVLNCFGLFLTPIFHFNFDILKFAFIIIHY